MIRSFHRFVFLGLALVLGACSALGTGPTTYYHKAEKSLGTDKPDELQFHSLIYYPDELALHGPGMVIGIEKSDAKQVLAEAKKQTYHAVMNTEESRKTDDWLQEKLQETSKAMFISHVVQYDKKSKGDFLFNSYNPTGKYDISHPTVEVNNWKAIVKIRDSLELALNDGTYSHVVFVSMGWNTNQVEAIQNYNSIRLQLVSSLNGAPNAFRPYFIGVTWPSQWDSDWIEPVIEFSSVVNKANDADEVAAGWMGSVFQYGVLPVAKAHSKRVMVIGHSFGARATSHVVCRGTILTPPVDSTLVARDMQPNDVEWLIGWQGAYSLHRFSEKGAGEISYKPDCPAAQKLIFTASINDKAAQKATVTGAPFAGTYATWKSLADKTSKFQGEVPPFDFLVAGATNPSDSPTLCVMSDGAKAPGKFAYINANEVIKFVPPNSGAISGAHSDIYRDQSAKLLWNVMNATTYSQCKGAHD